MVKKSIGIGLGVISIKQRSAVYITTLKFSRGVVTGVVTIG